LKLSLRRRFSVHFLVFLIKVGFKEEVGEEEEVAGVHNQSQVNMLRLNEAFRSLGFCVEAVYIHGDAEHHLSQLKKGNGHGHDSGNSDSQ